METLQKPFIHEKAFSTSKKVLIIHSNIQDAIGTLCSSAQPARNKMGIKAIILSSSLKQELF